MRAIVATARSFGVFVSVSPASPRSLVAETRALRDAEFLVRGRYDSVPDLSAPSHMPRNLMSGYQAEPKIETVG